MTTSFQYRAEKFAASPFGRASGHAWQIGGALCRPVFHRKTYVKHGRMLTPDASARVADGAASSGNNVSASGREVIVHAAASPSSKRSTLRISGSIFNLRKLRACSGQ